MFNWKLNNKYCCFFSIFHLSSIQQFQYFLIFQIYNILLFLFELIVRKMSRVPKLASKAIKNQESTPLFAWIRDFFLHVKRDPITPSPGHAGPDGKAVFQSANRFPNTQSSRGVEPALAQGGVHHKIADNYYYQRDGRRDVLPPTPLYKIDTQGKLELKKPTGEAISLEQLNEQVEAMVKGPQLNYGFSTKVPTPGFSYEWTRSVGNEEPSQQVDPQMARAQKYDKFANSGP